MFEIFFFFIVLIELILNIVFFVQYGLVNNREIFRKLSDLFWQGLGFEVC